MDLVGDSCGTGMVGSVGRSTLRRFDGDDSRTSKSGDSDFARLGIDGDEVAAFLPKNDERFVCVFTTMIVVVVEIVEVKSRFAGIATRAATLGDDVNWRPAGIFEQGPTNFDRCMLK